MSTSMENSKHQATRLQVLAVVAFYMAAALVMVIANKWVLNTSTLPLTFLFAQLVLAVLLIQACTLARVLTLPPFDPQLCRTIAGVVVVNVVGLVFNTLCLKLVDASYFQVARGLVLPLTVLLASLLLKSMPPKSTLLAVALVCAGFFYGITPSAASPTNAANNTHLGIIYGVLSALMIAVHAILVKWSMRHVDVRDMDASYVTNIAYLTNLLSALGLFPILVLTGEVWGWKALVTNADGELWTFLVGSLITGTFGFFICMAALLSITVTSPVTHMFSSAVRSVLQAFLGIAVFGDVLTVPRAVSLALITAGSALYAYCKAVKPPAPAAGGAAGDKADVERGGGGGGGESVPMLSKEDRDDADDEEMDRLEREHAEDVRRRAEERAKAAAAKGAASPPPPPPPAAAAAAATAPARSSSEKPALAAADNAQQQQQQQQQSDADRRAAREKVERHTSAAFGASSDDDDDDDDGAVEGDDELAALEKELLGPGRARKDNLAGKMD